MSAKLKKIWFPALLMLTVVYPLTGFAQVNPKLNKYLSNHDFLDLMTRFGKDSVVLILPGKPTQTPDSSAFVDGFRTQVFAGSNRRQAQNIADDLKEKVDAGVHLIESADGLVKVQVGDYTVRREAEDMLLALWKMGYRSAWLVPVKIEQAPRKPARVTPSVTAVQPEFYFGVQVFASNSADGARTLSRSLKGRVQGEVQIIEGDGLWKVVLGKFVRRDSAEALLIKLRKTGFEDAWITQIN